MPAPATTIYVGVVMSVVAALTAPPFITFASKFMVVPVDEFVTSKDSAQPAGSGL
jgi:hypothetical protein